MTPCERGRGASATGVVVDLGTADPAALAPINRLFAADFTHFGDAAMECALPDA